jgi:hypothetical protein
VVQARAWQLFMAAGQDTQVAPQRLTLLLLETQVVPLLQKPLLQVKPQTWLTQVRVPLETVGQSVAVQQPPIEGAHAGPPLFEAQ